MSEKMRCVCVFALIYLHKFRVPSYYLHEDAVETEYYCHGLALGCMSYMSPVTRFLQPPAPPDLSPVIMVTMA
jgi:hypothetical protein